MHIMAHNRRMDSTHTIIRKLLDLKLKQADIAREIGLPHWTVSRWAAGTVPLSADAALRLRDLLTRKSKGVRK